MAHHQATAAAASAAVREGLWARLAFREASGWLAHQGHWIHPVDLALRDAGLTGSYAAARLGERLPSVLPATASAIETVPEVPEDQEIALALTVARLWRRLVESRTWRPLQDPDVLAAALAPLGEGDPPAVLAERLQRLRPPEDLPPLLVAGLLARDWEQAGRRDRLSLPGLFSPPASGRRRAARRCHSGQRRCSGCTGWRCSRGEDGCRCSWKPWPRRQRAASQELARLQRAEARAAKLARTARSRLPAAATLALRRPVVTARSLADGLGDQPSRRPQPDPRTGNGGRHPRSDRPLGLARLRRGVMRYTTPPDRVTYGPAAC